MIKIFIKKENEVIVSIKVNGHACFNEMGKDIVCAGVSTAVITTVNAILEFDKTAIKYEEKPFLIENIKKDDITNKLLENLVNILKNIEVDYSENVCLKEE